MNILKNLGSAALLMTAVSIPFSVHAEMFWSDNSITMLHSGKYLNPFSEEKQELTTMTLEHASGHNWGDAFMFIDRHNGRGQYADFNEIYGEVSPRFSVGAITGSKIEFGPVSNVLIATTYEMNNFGGAFPGDQDNYLYGVGLDWTLPGFAFFQTNFFYADNENIDDDLQVTIVYGVPFSIWDVGLMLDGYLDWSSAESDHASDFHFNPQLRVNIGSFFGITKSKLEAGIEYSYWSNKFGVMTDKNESAFSGIVKFHF